MRIRTDRISDGTTPHTGLLERAFTCDDNGQRYLVLVNNDKTQAVGITAGGRVDTWSFPTSFINVRYDVVVEP